MEYKIGEVFELDGVKLRVDVLDVSGLECWYCYYGNKFCYHLRNYIGLCAGPNRSDGKDIVFTEVKE